MTVSKVKTPISFRIALDALVHRSLVVSGAVVALCMVTYCAGNLTWTAKRSQDLILTQVAEQARSAYMAQDILSVEKELNRFVESWNATQTLQVEIEVRDDTRLVARSGSVDGASLFQVSKQKTDTLPNGKTVTVHLVQDSTQYVIQATALLLVIESGILLLFLGLRRRLRKLSKELASPISDSISWVEQLTKALPSSLDSPGAPEDSGLEEVATLTKSVRTFVDEMKRMETQLGQAHADRVRIEIAEQIIHDLRSPLSTLDLLISDPNAEPKRAAISGAVERIRGIVRSLQRTSQIDGALKISENLYRHAQQPLALVVPASQADSLLSAVVDEKRIAHGERVRLIRSSQDGPLVQTPSLMLEPSLLQRSLSNIIDNALEALREPSGVVTVGSKVSHLGLSIVIRDQGIGIAPELLKRLPQRGLTVGKPTGNGLGLSYAHESITSWGGTLQLTSEVGVGTQVHIFLPSKGTSRSEIVLHEESLLVIVDDDQLVHQIWQAKLKADQGKDLRPNVIHLVSPEELRAWHSQASEQDLARAIFIVDHEFGLGRETGIEAITTLGLSSKCILISGRASEDSIKSAAQKINLACLCKDGLAELRLTFGPDRTKQASGDAIRRRNPALTQQRPDKATPMEVNHG